MMNLQMYTHKIDVIIYIIELYLAQWLVFAGFDSMGSQIEG